MNEWTNEQKNEQKNDERKNDERKNERKKEWMKWSDWNEVTEMKSLKWMKWNDMKWDEMNDRKSNNWIELNWIDMIWYDVISLNEWLTNNDSTSNWVSEWVSECIQCICPDKVASCPTHLVRHLHWLIDFCQTSLNWSNWFAWIKHPGKGDHTRKPDFCLTVRRLL